MLPIILGAAAVGVGGVGVAKGCEAVGKFKEVEKRAKTAQNLHEQSIQALQAKWNRVDRRASLYGELQLRVRRNVLKRFVEFIHRVGRKGKLSDQDLLEKLDGISLEQLQDFQSLAWEAEEVTKVLRNAADAGVAAGAVAVGVANAFGAVAVPQFFGLFAKQVAVAELGLPGVAMWLGGGNLVLGGAVLGGVALAPAIAIGGFQLAGKSEKALTEVLEYEAKVNVELAKHVTAKEFLERLYTQLLEQGKLLHRLESRAIQALDELEQMEFDPCQDAAKFQEVALLVKALVELLKTPILDDQGNINPIVDNIRAKYRKFGDSNP